MDRIDVFISYSHNDTRVMQEMVAYLESVGLQCWYAPRNIEPGADWSGSIINAIKAASHFVLIYSSSSNASDQVFQEVNAASSTGCNSTIINFKIEDVPPIPRMQYHINTRQWMDALTEPREAAYARLAKKIRTDLGMGGVDPSQTHRKETAKDRRLQKEQEKAEEEARRAQEKAEEEARRAQEKAEEEARRAQEKAEEENRKEQERIEREQEKARKEQERQERRERLHALPIRRIVIVAAVLLILLIVLIFLLTRKETVSVSLNDYLTVTYEGYDSRGTATGSLDIAALKEDLQSVEWKREELETYLSMGGDLFGEDLTAETIEKSVDFNDILEKVLADSSVGLSQIQDLSNGDVLTLTWTLDGDLLEDLCDLAWCSITWSDETFTVEGLEEWTDYDPFGVLEVSFSGMDGEGTAELVVTAQDEMDSALCFETDVSEGLSNGDIITVTVTNDPDAFKDDFNMALAATQKEYVVSGLKEWTDYDPFEVLEVSFSGMDGEGTVELVVTAQDEVGSALSFEAWPSDGLSNGDLVTISLTNDIDAFAEEYGVILTVSELTCTVEGLSTYVTGREEIPEETMEKIQSELTDSFNAYAALNWDPDVLELRGFDCIGSYLLSAKYDSSPVNLLYLVYQVNVEYYVLDSEQAVDEIITYYWCAGYSDLILEGDGTISLDYADILLPEESFVAQGLTFPGYETLNELTREIVTTRVNSYTYENLVEDQTFGYEITHLVEGPMEDAVEYDGHSYYVFETLMTWEEAEAFCESLGGHLVTISSEEENEIVTELLEDHPEDIYLIGVRRESDEGNPYSTWVTGEAVDYANWGTGEPESIDNQLVGTITNVMIGSTEDSYIDIGQWVDTEDSGLYFICEWDPDGDFGAEDEIE